MNDTEQAYLEELQTYMPGLEVERFFRAWRTALIFWRSIWGCSSMDWSRYRLTMWQRFTRWLSSAGRRSRDLTGFAAAMSRDARLESVGRSKEEREAFLALLALPPAEQLVVVQQFRNHATVIVALVRMYQDRQKQQYEVNDESAGL